MFPLDTVLRRLPVLLLLAGTIILFALAMFGVHSWLASRDTLTRLAATVDAQKRILAQAAGNEQLRNAALAKTLSHIAVAKRQVQTPADVIAQVPQVLPSLPQPVLFTLSAPTSARPVPDAQVSVPQADLKPLYDYAQDCRACSAKLAAAEGDLADEQSKVAALTKERDAATKSATGTFWLRVRRGAKWFAIGAALGALATESAHR
jgi:hypothetical protein